MKRLFQILAGIGFVVMLLGGLVMDDPSLLAFLLAFGGLGIFAGSQYMVSYLEWLGGETEW